MTSTTITLDYTEFKQLENKAQCFEENIEKIRQSIYRVYGITLEELSSKHEFLQDSDRKANLYELFRTGKL